MTPEEFEKLEQEEKTKDILKCDKSHWHNGSELKEDKEKKVDEFYRVLKEKYKDSKEKILFLKGIHFPNDTKSNHLNEALEDIAPLSVFFANCTFYGRLEIFPPFTNNEFLKESIRIMDSKILNGGCRLFNLKTKNLVIMDLDTEAITILGDIKRLHLQKSEVRNLNLRESSIKYATLKDITINQIFNTSGTSFESTLDFRNVECKGKLNLENTRLADETNFLGLKISDDLYNITRETARKIKYSFEKISNKIEANKYHSIELEKREEELKEKFINSIKSIFKKEKKTPKFSNFQEFLSFFVYFFHGISSSYSRDYLLVVLWILSVSMYTNLLYFKPYEVNWTFSLHMLLFLILSILVYLFLKNKYSKEKYYGTVLISLMFGCYLYIDSGMDLSLENLLRFSNVLNSKIVEEDLNIGLFANKILLGYLYYQFIIAVRRDTLK